MNEKPFPEPFTPNNNMPWVVLIGFCYFLSYSSAYGLAQPSLTWELNLANFSKNSAKSSSFNYPLDTTSGTLQFRYGSLSLEVVWDLSVHSWQVSLVQQAAASGSKIVCTSRAFIIPSGFDKQIFTFHLKENENLLLKQGDTLLWESQSCSGNILKHLKSKADHMVLQSPSHEKYLDLAQPFSYRRTLQERNLTITQNGPSSSLSTTQGGHKNRKALAMEIAFPVAAFLLLLLCLVLVFIRRRKAKANQINIGTTTQKSRREEDEVLLKTLAPGLPPRFTYAEMHEATNGFQKRLGEGAHGAVYEGTLHTGSKIAVKNFLEPESKTCRKGFCAEVLSIGEKKHVNLVQLVGFCVEDDHRMLVYELMENGSLNKVLFGPKSEKNKAQLPLSWERRKAIAIDTARALAFLHEKGEQKTPVIHCDVKPENILLNENWEAKVSDFGLAKLLWAAKGNVVHAGDEHEEEDEENHGDDGKADGKQKPSAFPSAEISSRMSQLSGLKGVRGTLGYVAPEWTSGDAEPERTVTTASDVYSFGVVLLELVAGRRCMVPGQPFLPGLAFDTLKDGHDFSALLDPRLHDPAHSQGIVLETSTLLDLEDVQKIVNIALWCLQEDLALRPTTVDVLDMLTTEKSTPVPPFCDYFAGSSHFFDDVENPHHSHLFSDSTSGFQDKELETSTTSSIDTTSWQTSILSGR